MAWKYVQYNGETGKRRTVEGGGGGGASSFSELEDVNFSDLQNGQVPKYNSSTQKWENADESGGTVTDVQVNGESVVNQQGEAEITSYKEVTQAEYNALPASKETDGVLYCIKDVGGADSFPPLIYSDEEREIGVWRDGKPLYQKTLKRTDMTVLHKGTTDYDEYTNISVSDLSVDTMVSFVGVFKRQWSQGYRWHNFGYYEKNSTDIVRGSLRWNKANNRLEYCFLIPQNQTVPEAYITIQYTKTTDTAGSGTWTTQGEYAHHYSTTEHIIGTWIDGKPIYEKVFAFSQRTTISEGSWVDTEFLTGDISVVIFVSGIDIQSNKGTAWHFLGADVTGTYIKLYQNRDLTKDIALTHFIMRYTKTTD